MHCKTAQLEIATLDSRSVELENHLSQCPDCRDFAQFASHTVDDLATWRDGPVPAHMMQRVRDVIAASTFAESMLYVAGSTSTRTGVSPF